MDSYFAELATVLSTIAQIAGVKKDELRQCSRCYSTNLSKYTRLIRRIPLKVSMTTHEVILNPRPDAQQEFNTPTDKIQSGIGEFELRHNNRKLIFWQWSGRSTFNGNPYIANKNLHIVKAKDLWLYYRILKHLIRRKGEEIDPPILSDSMFTDIYTNSIDFLIKGKQQKNLYNRYKIPYKRGLLFYGPPGCGKSLSCRWLRRTCQKRGLSWKTITIDDYESALNHGNVHALFTSARNGIICFDDMDIIIENRHHGNSNIRSLHQLLAELDGIDSPDGVVYIFTSNREQRQIDEAFLRPGRIDVWLHFDIPTKELREKFIMTRFHSDITDEISQNDILEQTKGYSFAELEEIRKLFCIDLINNRRLDLKRIFNLFRHYRKNFNKQQIKGFGNLTNQTIEDTVIPPLSE